MAAPEFTITQGTTAPSLEGTVSDKSGPVSLTTASGVTFTLRDESGTILIDAVAARIVDAAGGIVAYDWQTGDTATVGTFYGKFTVTWQDATTTAWPTNKSNAENYILVNVVDDAGALG